MAINSLPDCENTVAPCANFWRTWYLSRMVLVTWVALVLVAAIMVLPWSMQSQLTAAEDPAAVEDTEDEAPEKPKRNPFVPRDQLTQEELFEYIDRLREAPRSVQAQEEYGPALYECAERLLAKQPAENLRAFAELTRLMALHVVAQYDNEEAQEKLVKLANGLAKDQAKEVARAAQFYLLEDKLLQAETAAPEDLPKLLDEAHEFLKTETNETLDARHLRIATAITKLINNEPAGDRVEQDYKRFGELFATSDFRELSRYGKRIAKGVPKKAQDLTGKPMPIAGVLHDGQPFNIEQLRGKVVLVDFWATWCGPCRAALPALKELYAAQHDAGFEIVGVSLDNDLEALKELIESEGLAWPNIFDADDSDPNRKSLAEQYGVNAIPATFLLDQKGNVVAANLHGEKLTAKIEELLSGKTPSPEDNEKEKATEPAKEPEQK